MIPVIILVLIGGLCIPVKQVYKDGGTVAYYAVLYSYTKYHRLQSDDTYYEGTEFLFFPHNFID